MKKKPTAKKPRRRQPKNPYREAQAESVMDRINAECQKHGFDPYEPCESETISTGQSIRIEVPEQNVGFFKGLWRKVFQ